MPIRHVALAVAVAVVWGLNFVAIHIGLESMPPLLFAVLRFTFVAFPGVLLVRRPPVPWRWVVAVGVFLSAAQFGLLFVSMDQGMPAGLASLVVQLQVLFTIALAVALLGERPSRMQIVGAAVALGGIAIIFAGRAEGVPAGAMLLCIAGAASWGAGNICVRRAQAPDALALVIWSSLVAPLPLLALSLAFEGPDRIGDALAGVDASGLAALAYIVVGASLFGYGVWTWLLKTHPASRVAPFSLLVPVVGLAAAWLALDEVPTAAELVGAVVVLAGLGITLRGLRAPRRDHAPTAEVAHQAAR